MRIALDPGHGGTDVGAVSQSGLREAYVTALAVAFLFARLRKLGHDVMVTREAGFVSLSDRCAKANEWKADLFVSIHANSVKDTNAHGSETWYYQESETGKALAGALQRALVTEGGLRDRGIKATTSIAVLRDTAMPAALVELAFLSNPDEEKLLASSAWLGPVSEALADALHVLDKL